MQQGQRAPDQAAAALCGQDRQTYLAEVAHLRDQGIDFAIFNADATDHSEGGREALLAQLVAVARRNHLNVDKAALAFKECGQIKFFGAPDLVRYLASLGVPRWTHTLDV
jgi:hypothetical protein